MPPENDIPRKKRPLPDGQVYMPLEDDPVGYWEYTGGTTPPTGERMPDGFVPPASLLGNYPEWAIEQGFVKRPEPEPSTSLSAVTNAAGSVTKPAPMSSTPARATTLMPPTRDSESPFVPETAQGRPPPSRQRMASTLPPPSAPDFEEQKSSRSPPRPHLPQPMSGTTPPVPPTKPVKEAGESRRHFNARVFAWADANPDDLQARNARAQAERDEASKDRKVERNKGKKLEKRRAGYEAEKEAKKARRGGN
ncbi:hypothetical protein H2200_007014 [Cladophialophora chaetospira]|uniref:Uncharacterized protein n=1 Tax=Cladophialophora chaetospira TaxID=386627 RepID=A0AA38X7F9_9EURO|nr:hypothetical protein H2200_007014 [Cladophialophora chaetospira]